jgi:hypothetical protein
VFDDDGLFQYFFFVLMFGSCYLQLGGEFGYDLVFVFELLFILLLDLMEGIF